MTSFTYNLHIVSFVYRLRGGGKGLRGHGPCPSGCLTTCVSACFIVVEYTKTVPSS